MVTRLVGRGGPDAHPVDVLTAVLPTDDESIENWRFSMSVRAAGLFDPELLRFDRQVAEYWAGYLPARLAGLVAVDADEAADHLLVALDGVAVRAIADPDAWPATRQITHLERAFASLDPIGTEARTGQETETP
ncbi:TetR family transcriptional regulator C-terminal domain-containing protein [Actinospongicola halichondriae]|uniref:TetR family transcriptional regulator C-terminal domain-containing protein n=1 Tax=Actinospongicola halichondriae TaxID=3236844 RepID=UPI003D5BF578